MIMTEENGSAGGGGLSQCHSTTKISHGLVWDRTRTTAVRSALVNIITATNQLARGGAVG
jgi:hypothetical protein